MQERINLAIQDHYQKLFSVERKNLRVSIRRISEPELLTDYEYTIQVVDTRNKKRLGYQTIWIHVLKNAKLISKFPVSLFVEIRVPVLRTVQKISRRELLTHDMFRCENVFIDGNWNSLISNPDEVTGLTSKRVIRAGELLDRRILEIPPIVERGERIKLQIQNGSLVIATTGIAKDDAAIGQEIDVVSEPTGKRMRATVIDDGLAIVEQE